MGDISPSSMDATSAQIAAISAKIMIVSAIVVFLVVAILFCLNIYVRYNLLSYEDPTIVSWRRRTARQGPPTTSATRRKGLDPATLQSLPTQVYDPKEFKEALECPVCLSEVSEGEKVRLLPKCNHGFHVGCIDMWFHSHSTCPLCRNPVVSLSSQNPSDNQEEAGVYDSSSSESESESDDDRSSYASANSTEAPPVFPTNVLFWGDETQLRSHGLASEEGLTSGSSSSSSTTVGAGRQRNGLVIDIPRELCEDCLSSPPQLAEDEMKSPVLSTLRSLRRLLSRGKRMAPSPHSQGSSSSAVEQV